MFYVEKQVDQEEGTIKLFNEDRSENIKEGKRNKGKSQRR